MVVARKGRFICLWMSRRPVNQSQVSQSQVSLSQLSQYLVNQRPAKKTITKTNDRLLGQDNKWQRDRWKQRRFLLVIIILQRPASCRVVKLTATDELDGLL
jgi:hypothetical protein